jgi:uncharacterized damage-inducible protein DinB
VTLKRETDMTRLRAIVGVFAFGFMSVFAASRAHTQTETVSLQAELLKDWSGQKETMHKIAAEMPADKYSFRPTEAQQTFGERTVHVATVNVALLGMLGGTAPKPTIDPKATTKDAAIKALDDSFDYGAALLKQQTDQTLLQPLASAPKFLGPSSRARIITFLAGHTWDIYGQMVVYLRLNGHVPPASQKM